MRYDYQITIRTHLSKSIVSQLGDYPFYCLPTGDTILITQELDHSGFYGLLIRCRDLGLTIISVLPLPNYREEQKREGSG